MKISVTTELVAMTAVPDNPAPIEQPLASTEPTPISVPANKYCPIGSRGVKLCRLKSRLPRVTMIEPTKQPMSRPAPSRINGASREITLIKLCAAGALKVMLCGNMALKL